MHLLLTNPLWLPFCPSWLIVGLPPDPWHQKSTTLEIHLHVHHLTFHRSSPHLVTHLLDLGSHLLRHLRQRPNPRLLGQTTRSVMSRRHPRGWVKSSTESSRDPRTDPGGRWGDRWTKEPFSIHKNRGRVDPDLVQSWWLKTSFAPGATVQ